MNKCALTFMLKCLVADKGHFDVKSIFFSEVLYPENKNIYKLLQGTYFHEL